MRFRMVYGCSPSNDDKVDAKIDSNQHPMIRGVQYMKSGVIAKIASTTCVAALAACLMTGFFLRAWPRRRHKRWRTSLLRNNRLVP